MDEEKFDLEQFPTSESAKRMLSYVTPGFYDNSYVGKWLYQVMGLEYDDAKKLAEELQYQMFPETATWGLMYHEIKWGLPVRPNLSYEERRQQIYQKRDYKAPMTPYRMEIYLKNATGFDVVVADCHDSGPYDYHPTHPNAFKIFFTGEGTLDTKVAFDMLKKIRQSHTTYAINDRVIIIIVHTEYVLLEKLGIHFELTDVTGKIVNSKENLKFEIIGASEKIEASVVIRRNLWYLDGEVNLDGSRVLNALDGKEIL